jgi:hypothetical protein
MGLAAASIKKIVNINSILPVYLIVSTVISKHSCSFSTRELVVFLVARTVGQVSQDSQSDGE